LATTISRAASLISPSSIIRHLFQHEIPCRGKVRGECDHCVRRPLCAAGRDDRAVIGEPPLALSRQRAVRRRIQIAGGSSDKSFRGDATRWNPEELLVASASTCHLLWYLHLCATNDVVVLDHRDEPERY
jgi:hypothetical protein